MVSVDVKLSALEIMFEVSNGSIDCQEFSVKSDVTCLKNDKGCHTLSMHCCKTPPTAKSLASHMMFKGADGCGWTNNVAFASICFDSVNATFAFSVQYNSTLDLGESLFWPSLTSVNQVFKGVNFSAQ